MFVISGGKGTGKTRALIGKVKAEDGILVCEDVLSMRARAYDYGITGLNIISYDELKEYYMKDTGVTSVTMDKPLYIHDINKFLNYKFSDICGYSVCSD